MGEGTKLAKLAIFPYEFRLVMMSYEAATEATALSKGAVNNVTSRSRGFSWVALKSTR